MQEFNLQTRALKDGSTVIRPRAWCRSCSKASAKTSRSDGLDYQRRKARLRLKGVSYAQYKREERQKIGALPRAQRFAQRRQLKDQRVAARAALLASAEHRSDICLRLAERLMQRAAYAETRPWLDPALEASEVFRVRYAHDPAFATRQRLKSSTKRWLQPERAAIWGSDAEKRRWWRATTSADGTITKSVMRELQALRFCEYCGTELKDERHIDHIVPLAAGGKHSAENLAATCAACNLEKSDKPLWLFLLRRRVPPPPLGPVEKVA